MSFLDQFTRYKDYAPPGVLLPKIDIDKGYYSELGVADDICNYDFLRHLCMEGVKLKGINDFPNKQTYFNRIKAELKILSDLGFIDYILLNWDILNYCHTRLYYILLMSLK
jgi:DNA polymerase III alpha subunit